MLIALDTNVLVRVFIDDNSSTDQVVAARELAKRAAHIFVPQIVQVELAWVLSSAYRLKKSQILVILEHLQSHSIFTLQNPLSFADALTLYKTGGADFSDYLIMIEANRAHAEFYSFDRNLLKSGAGTVAKP